MKQNQEKIHTRITDPFKLEQTLSKYEEDTSAFLAENALPKFIETLSN